MRAARLAALALFAAVSAAAPPAASLSRSYYCFFDPGRAELSPRCQETTLEFLGWWHRMLRGEDRRWPDGALVPAHAMQVEVHGHADAAESAAGEASVSRARAEAVASLLRLNGVLSEVIKVVPFGADRPLVPASGAEPQNRRVQLITR